METPSFRACFFSYCVALLLFLLLPLLFIFFSKGIRRAVQRNYVDVVYPKVAGLLRFTFR